MDTVCVSCGAANPGRSRLQAGSIRLYDLFIYFWEAALLPLARRRFRDSGISASTSQESPL